MSDERIQVTASSTEDLAEDECWRLLIGTELGRLAVRDGDGMEIFPVNYGVHGRRIVFRTGFGTKLNSLTVHHRVAFEVDGQDGELLWSVVLKGDARTPELGTELQELHGLGLTSWSPVAKSVYVVVEPMTITGRRFRKELERDPDWR